MTTNRQTEREKDREKGRQSEKKEIVRNGKRARLVLERLC